MYTKYIQSTKTIDTFSLNTTKRIHIIVEMALYDGNYWKCIFDKTDLKLVGNCQDAASRNNTKNIKSMNF